MDASGDALGRPLMYGWCPPAIEFTASYTAICVIAMWIDPGGGGCPAPGTGAFVGLKIAASAWASHVRTESLTTGGDAWAPPRSAVASTAMPATTASESPRTADFFFLLIPPPFGRAWKSLALPLRGGRDGLDDAERIEPRQLRRERGLAARRGLEDEEAQLVLGNVDRPFVAHPNPLPAEFIGYRASPPLSCTAIVRVAAREKRLDEIARHRVEARAVAPRRNRGNHGTLSST